MRLTPLEGDQMLLERHAEHCALSILCPASFADCLKEHDFAPAIEVSSTRGKTTLTIRGSDVCDKRTWRKFLVQRGGVVYQLTAMADAVAGQYKAWLLKEHTERYRSLASDAHMAWFDGVVALTVVRHIMQQKYEFYAQGLETFADAWVAVQTGAVLMYHNALRDAARLINHAVKDPTQAQQLIEQLAETLRPSVREMLQVSRKPLPPLPPGAALPRALLLAASVVDMREE